MFFIKVDWAIFRMNWGILDALALNVHLFIFNFLILTTLNICYKMQLKTLRFTKTHKMGCHKYAGLALDINRTVFYWYRDCFH